MTRSQQASSLLLLLLMVVPVAQQAADGPSATEDRIRTATATCCDRNRADCCQNVVTFRQPLACGYENDVKTVETVHDCLQNRLYEPPMRIAYDDSSCCSVFESDENDATGRCAKVCTDTMRAPGIDAIGKMKRIRECSMIPNPLEKCFHRCRQLRQTGVKIEVLHFDEYCNATLLRRRDAATSSTASPPPPPPLKT